MKVDHISFAKWAFVKKNLCDSSKDLAWYKPNHYPSEPWFIPSPNPTSEHDGILLNVILDGEIGKSYLGIFDAKTMELINSAYLPVSIPFPLHGRFYD